MPYVDPSGFMRFLCFLVWTYGKCRLPRCVLSFFFFFTFLLANFPSFNQTRLSLVCHSVLLLLRDSRALLSRALMMLDAVVFMRPSRYAYGNMACLISAAGGEAADTPTASLRVRLPHSLHVERNCLQMNNCDISLTSTFWLPSLLTSASEGIKHLLRPHQKKKKKK